MQGTPNRRGQATECSPLSAGPRPLYLTGDGCHIASTHECMPGCLAPLRRVVQAVRMARGEHRAEESCLNGDMSEPDSVDKDRSSRKRQLLGLSPSRSESSLPSQGDTDVDTEVHVHVEMDPQSRIVIQPVLRAAMTL